MESTQDGKGCSGAYPAGRPGTTAISTAWLGLGLGLGSAAAAARSGSSSPSRRGPQALGPGRCIVLSAESGSALAICPAGLARCGPAPAPAPPEADSLSPPDKLRTSRLSEPCAACAPRAANREVAGAGLRTGAGWGRELSRSPGSGKKSGVGYRPREPSLGAQAPGERVLTPGRGVEGRAGQGPLC